MKLLLASSFAAFEAKLDAFSLPLRGKHVVCIITAALAEDNHDWLEGELTPIRSRAKSFATYDLTGKSRAQIEDDLSKADVIYVSGGNTYYLLEQVQKSGFADVLATLLDKGVMYIGSSAGAILTCPRIDFIADMDEPDKADLSDYSGLGLVDFLIMPHTDHPVFASLAAKIIEVLKGGSETIMALRDDQALYVDGAHVQVY